MRNLHAGFIFAGLLATTSTLAYSQAFTLNSWPEYHEGLAVNGSPTPQPYPSCERKLVRSQWLWECDPARRNGRGGPATTAVRRRAPL
jgi:hypothetical protein